MMVIKLTKRERTLLYTLACVAIVVGGISLLLLPAFARNAQVADEVSAARMQQMELQMKSDLVDSYLSRVVELEKETADLHEGLFEDTDPIEDLDLFIVNMALQVKVSPQQLKVELPDFRGAVAYTGDGTAEKEPETNEKVKHVGTLVRNITISGSCGYDQFVALMDVYDKCPQLLISAAEFTYRDPEIPESRDAFSITLSAYTMAASGTAPSYLEV